MQIYNTGRPFTTGKFYNNLYLSGQEYNIDLTNVNDTRFVPDGATLTQAIRCALANCVAFSSILGRAGPLEAFFVALFGTIGFELLRDLVILLGLDYGEAYIIFVYGGFMGLFMGLFRSFREKGERRTTENSPKYTGNHVSVAISFLGAVVLFAVFPILIIDPDLRVATLQPTVNTTGPLSIWYSMASAGVMSAAFSILINENLIARDIINGLVAGGVASLTSSLYFTNPVWPMVLGASAGMFQSIFQNVLEKKVARSKKIINTHSFILFGFQGILGGVFASIFRKVVVTRNDGF